MDTNKRKPASLCRKQFPGVLLAVLCLYIVFPCFGSAAQKPENPELERVYRQMQAVQKSFHSFSAKISQKKYTAILKEFGETETGDFYVARPKDPKIGLMVRQEISTPGKTILTIKGNLLTIYRPSIKQAQIANLSKETKSKAEFLSFGIGQSPDDLKKNFAVSYAGEELVGGAPCAVLVLKPKDRKTAATYAAITMWVKKSSGIPIQNKLQEPNNDYLLVTFSDEKLNPNIPESKFEQKLPKGIDLMRY